MNSMIDQPERKELQVIKEIKRMHSKLMHLYDRLDEFDCYDTSYIKLWLKAQQDLFDPEVDSSKPYWVK